MNDISPEPDQSGLIIYVGQDQAGHWLVQDTDRRIEGRFTSFVAARNFARAEGEIHHAAVALASAPLVPFIAFSTAPAFDHGLPLAA